MASSHHKFTNMSSESNDVSFLQLLKQAYTQNKRQYEENRGCLSHVPLLVMEKTKTKKAIQREERTRSKSRKRRAQQNSGGQQVIRKSKRLTKHDDQTQKLLCQEFIELDRQPLWHPNRIKPDRSRQKIQRIPATIAITHKLKQNNRKQSQKIVNNNYREQQLHQIDDESMKNRNRIRSTDPLYQFYSEPPIVHKDNIGQQQRQAQRQEQNLVQDDQQEQEQKQNICFGINNTNTPPAAAPQAQPLQLQPQQRQPSPQQQLQQSVVMSFTATKKQSSLLSIQSLLDQYFQYKATMRTTSELTKFPELVRYIREIKGYNFDLDVLRELMGYNGALYRLCNVGGNWYVRGLGLGNGISTRLLRTKVAMMKSNQIDMQQ